MLLQLVGFLKSTVAGSITFTSGTYTRPADGNNPTISNTDIVTTGTTGPYYLDLLSVTNGTTPSQSDMDSGSGTGVLEKVTLGPQTNIEDLDGTLDLSVSITNGRIYQQYRDSSNTKSILTSTPTADSITYDASASVFSSAEIGNTDATSLIITFNKNVFDPSSSLVASDFDVQVNGSPATESAVAISGNTVDITLSVAVTAGQTVTVAYNGTALVGVDGEVVATFTAQSVTNNVSGGWAPGDDAELIAWYDADNASSVSQSPGDVTTVNDLSGNGYTLTAVGTPRTGDNTQNGLNLIDFAQASSERLTDTIDITAQGQIELVISMAARWDSGTNTNAALIAFDSATAANDWQLGTDSTTDFNTLLNLAPNIGGSITASGVPFNNFSISQIRFNRTGGTIDGLATGNAEIIIDGTSRGSLAYTLDMDQSQVLILFANRAQNAFSSGALGELIISTDLTTTSDAYTYLSGKWIP